ncbi:hypothetical protein ACQJBY_017782 [Aegilops geniculata]
MSSPQEIQLQIRGSSTPEQESGHGENGAAPKAAERRRPGPGTRGVRWWLMVLLDMLVVLCGQTVATLLGRYYYNSGGNSKWMATLTISGGSPLLAILLLLTPRDPVGEPRPAAAKIVPIYLGLGTLIGFDNLMYSYALQYLPVSTFALVAATQLAFNSITSRLINAQRFTALIANSVVVLTFSAALLGVGSSSDGTSAADLPRGKYTLGFILTLSASAVFALILSLFEVTFEKAVRGRTLRWVLRVQMCTNFVAATVAVCGLLASGEWRTIPGEMAAFEDGRARYVATLVGTAVSWQAMSVATLRLITRVSSLFANVTGTVSLPLVPVFAVVLFGDRMAGIKAVAMLMAVWGFLSYVYQHYLDGRRAAAMGGQGGAAECCVCKARAGGEAVLLA